MVKTHSDDPAPKRISISFISTVFALFALAICIYSLFYSFESATRTQGIYWFCIALVAAIVPHLKDLAPYVKRVKVGDVEVELNELKKEVQAVKKDIKKLDNVMMQLSKVSETEASLSPEFREVRQEVFANYAKSLTRNTPEEKLHKQEFFTQMHLRNASMDIAQLKEALNQLGYYHSSIDKSFSPELAQAIEKFQSEHVEDQPDGIAGPITLSKIDKLLRSQSS